MEEVLHQHTQPFKSSHVVWGLGLKFRNTANRVQGLGTKNLVLRPMMRMGIALENLRASGIVKGS